MKFLIDAQLPVALARFIRGQGHAAVHVADAGLAGADDPPIWDRAVREVEVIVSKDEDFAVRRTLTTRGPPVVWLRVGNCSNRALLAWFTLLWPEVVRRLAADDPLIEVV